MKITSGLLTVLLLAAAGSAGAHHTAADREDADRSADPHRVAVAPLSAPEISPGSMIAALTLLGGGLVVLRGRRRQPAEGPR